MIALFHDEEIGTAIYFHVQIIERAIGGIGPPLGLTHVFPSGRKVALKFEKVEDKQAYYKPFELNQRQEKWEDNDMPRVKGSKNKPKVEAEVVQTREDTPTKESQATFLRGPLKADPPKYASMDTAEELWELEFPDKVDLFRQLVQQRIDLKYEIDSMEDRIKEINGSLLPFFERNGLPGVSLEGGYLVRRHEGQSATLDKGKLVEMGVGVDVIEACTVRKKFVTVMVRGPKE